MPPPTDRSTSLSTASRGPGRRRTIHAQVESAAASGRRPDGIFLSDFEQGEIGPDLFRKAGKFGFEGLVSKHRKRLRRFAEMVNDCVVQFGGAFRMRIEQ
jgi:hypothetical protein